MMLVVSRYADEAVFIGADIMVMVTGVDRDGCVRLGLEAPRHTPIARAELVARKMKISENLPHKEIFSQMRESNYVWVKD